MIESGAGLTAELATRLAAATCYIMTGLRVVIADAWFRRAAENPELLDSKTERRQAYIQKWGERLLATGSVAERVGMGGRPRTVDRTVLAEVAGDIEAKAEEGKPYFDWTHAMTANAARVAESGSKSTAYATRLVQSMTPAKKVEVEYKVGRSPQIMAERVKLCRERIALAEEGKLIGMLQQVFWLDWCKIYVDAKGTTMLLTPEQKDKLGDTIVSVHKPVNKAQNVAIKVLCVVNAVWGPVIILFASGTTGVQINYTVSQTWAAPNMMVCTL